MLPVFKSDAEEKSRAQRVANFPDYSLPAECACSKCPWCRRNPAGALLDFCSPRSFRQPGQPVFSRPPHFYSQLCHGHVWLLVVGEGKKLARCRDIYRTDAFVSVVDSLCPHTLPGGRSSPLDDGDHAHIDGRCGCRIAG